MQTFYRIIQTNLKSKNVFFPVTEQDSTGFIYWQNVFQNELYDKNLIFDEKIEENISTDEYNAIVHENNVTKQSFYFMMSAISNKLKQEYYSRRSIKAKFLELNNMLKNIFISQPVKEKILNIFCKSQRIYYAFSRLAFIYRYKKAKIQINYDLYMNDILPDQKNTVLVFQNNAKYTFIVQDLIKIINNGLTNAPGFFLEPIGCKNPYTNIPFNKSTLYHIYFEIKSRICVMPDLFYRFFLCSFNLVKFKLNNENLIKEQVFKNYVKNTSSETLCNDIRTMLKENSHAKRLFIDEDFPEKRLVEIFSPYLELYYQGLYCHADEKKYLVKDVLYKKLFGFYYNNKLFGRKTFKKTFIFDKKGKFVRRYERGFNDTHIPFSQIKIRTWENFCEDWTLLNQENVNPYDDSEDSDDNEGENDEDSETIEYESEDESEDDDDENENENENESEDNDENVAPQAEDIFAESIVSNEESEDSENSELIQYIVAVELELGEENEDNNPENVPENNFFNYESETDSIS